jgi:hypothetical protein
MGTFRESAGGSSVGRVLFKSADSIIIALIPLLYVAINPSFGQNQAGDIDTWFYFGLAKQFWHQQGPDFHGDYYETRLPYIIPAAIIFSLASDRIAALILAYLVYCACAFSLFYVLRKHVPRPVAFLATILMVSDIYFMRTVGWQYVDGAVLAYGSLTFAALTAAATTRTTRYRYAFAALGGFLFLSMLIVHLGSVPLGLALVGYALLVFTAKQMGRQEWLTLALSISAGALCCQVIYGLLNIFLYRTGFLFEEQQIAAGAAALSVSLYFAQFKSLFVDGWWITVHLAAWIAVTAMIVAWLVRAYSPTRLQLYCMWAVFVSYLILFLFDYFRLTTFLGRSGLYSSFYLFLSYLFIGSIISNSVQRLSAMIISGLFLLSLALRYHFEVPLEPYLSSIPVWAVGIALGAIIAAVALVNETIARVLLVPVAVAMVLPIRWEFAYEHAIYAARNAVTRMAAGTAPLFAFSSADPIYGPVITGLVGSFTPRAWWLACREFPTCLQRYLGGTVLVISSENNPEIVASMASTVIPEVVLRSATRIDRPGQDFSIYEFLIIRSSPLVIPGAKLPSAVGVAEGNARIAVEGTKPGHLTFGAFATASRGSYEIVLRYSAEGDVGSWDITSTGTILAKGSIPNTGGSTTDLIRTIDLPEDTQKLEVRTFYSGHGRLVVESLSIKPLSVSPITH